MHITIYIYISRNWMKNQRSWRSHRIANHCARWRHQIINSFSAIFTKADRKEFHLIALEKINSRLPSARVRTSAFFFCVRIHSYTSLVMRIITHSFSRQHPSFKLHFESNSVRAQSIKKTTASCLLIALCTSTSIFLFIQKLRSQREENARVSSSKIHLFDSADLSSWRTIRRRLCGTSWQKFLSRGNGGRLFVGDANGGNDGSDQWEL